MEVLHFLPSHRSIIQTKSSFLRFFFLSNIYTRVATLILSSLILFSSCNKDQEPLDFQILKQGKSNMVLYDLAIFDQEIKATGGDVWESGIVSSVSQSNTYSFQQIHSQSMFALDCSNELCVAVGNFGRIYRSENFIDWIEINNNNQQLLKGVKVTQDFIYALGGHGYADGVIHRWNLDGSDQISFFSDTELRDLEESIDGSLVAVGYGTALRSNDQGLSWQLLDIETDFYRAIELDELSGDLFMIGWGGTLLKSMDHGLNWDRLIASNITKGNQKWTDITISSAGDILIVGESGLISYRDKMGAIISESRIAENFDFNAVLTFDDRVLVAGSSESIIEVSL